jgi:hypothetical protein
MDVDNVGNRTSKEDEPNKSTLTDTGWVLLNREHNVCFFEQYGWDAPLEGSVSWSESTFRFEPLWPFEQDYTRITDLFFPRAYYAYLSWYSANFLEHRERLVRGVGAGLIVIWFIVIGVLILLKAAKQFRRSSSER